MLQKHEFLYNVLLTEPTDVNIYQFPNEREIDIKVDTLDIRHELMERYGLRTVSGIVHPVTGAVWYDDIYDDLDKWMDRHFIEFKDVVAAMYSEYNPIDNYAMTETTQETSSGNVHDDGTDILTRTGTVATQGSTNGTTTDETSRTDTMTDTRATTTDMTQTTTGNNQTNTTHSVAAYDSQTLTTSDSSTDNQTVNNTVTNAGTVTNSGGTSSTITNGGNITSQMTSNDTVTNDLTDQRISDNKRTHSDNRKIEHSRSGNIGVTTSQQMIESEIRLKMFNNILDYICALYVNERTVWAC